MPRDVKQEMVNSLHPQRLSRLSERLGLRHSRTHHLMLQQ
jgi:gamma-glutamyl-gamma-aminobutyrate hydrolase PuuD